MGFSAFYEALLRSVGYEAWIDIEIFGSFSLDPVMGELIQFLWVYLCLLYSSFPIRPVITTCLLPYDSDLSITCVKNRLGFHARFMAVYLPSTQGFLLYFNYFC